LWQKEQNMNEGMREMNQPFVDNTYSGLYCTDLIRSAKWYQDHFGFKLLTCNPDFATVQVAPGRILFLGKDTSSPRDIGLISTNIDALRTHLQNLNASIEENDDKESVWFSMKDPDGNKVGIWSGDRFGCNTVTYTAASWVEDLNSVFLEEKEGIHVLASRIEGTQNLKMLTEKLLTVCSEISIVPKNKEIFTIVNPDQADTVYGCIELTNPLSSGIPTGFESIYISEQLYCVSTYPLNYQIREAYIDRYALLEHYTFNKPVQPAYILEFYDNDEIKAYLPVTYSH
jgi:hypothetical protein